MSTLLIFPPDLPVQCFAFCTPLFIQLQVIWGTCIIVLLKFMETKNYLECTPKSTTFCGRVCVMWNVNVWGCVFCCYSDTETVFDDSICLFTHVLCIKGFRLWKDEKAEPWQWCLLSVVLLKTSTLFYCHFICYELNFSDGIIINIWEMLKPQSPLCSSV